jgi:hypothetical protein
MTTQRLMMTLLIGALLAACGGPREKTTASFKAQNDSEHTLTVTLDLDESAAVDECEDESRSKTFTIGPRSQGEGELSMRCGYGPSVRIDAAVTRSDTSGKPQGYAFRSTVKLASSMVRVTSVRVYTNAQTEPLDIPVTPGAYVETNGLPADARLEDAFMVDYSTYFGPVARAFYDDYGNVTVIVSDQNDLGITAIGIPVDQVARDEMVPEHEYDQIYGHERDGFWFRDAYDYGFGHVISFGTQEKSLSIHCTERGCQVK